MHKGAGVDVLNQHAAIHAHFHFSHHTHTRALLHRFYTQIETAQFRDVQRKMLGAMKSRAKTF